MIAKRILVATIFCISANAFAEPHMLPNDPHRPTEAIIRDLGIQQEQFVACFQNVHPAKQDERPTDERVHLNPRGFTWMSSKS